MKSIIRIGAVLVFLSLSTFLFAGGSSEKAGEGISEQVLGGRTIKIASYLVDEGMKSYFTEGEGVSRITLAKEVFGIAGIEFVPISWDSTVNEIATSIASGDPIGDIFPIANRFVYNLAPINAIRPMDDVLDEEYYASLPGVHSKMRELYSSFGGKAYAISLNGNWRPNQDMGSGQGIIFNKDMFDAEGLEYPTSLQKRGEWTWDTFREYAKRLTKDTDGDGQVDQWGLGSRLDPWAVDQELYIYSNDAHLLIEENGVYKYATNRKEAIAAIQLLRDMINIDKSILIGDLNDVDAAMVDQAKTAMARIDLGALTGWDIPSKATLPNYGWAFLPKGPNAKDYVNPVWGVDVAFLPVTVEDPQEAKALVELINLLFEITSDYRDLSKYNEDILKYYSAGVEDQDSLDTIKMMIDKIILWDVLPDMGQADNDAHRFAMVDAVMKPKSPQATLDEIAPRVQSYIDKYFNKK